jgi:hypothetical protein
VERVHEKAFEVAMIDRIVDQDIPAGIQVKQNTDAPRQSAG